MLTRWRSSDIAISSIGMGLVSLGLLWENLKGPTLVGWLAIGAGLAVIFLTQKPRSTPLRWPILILIIMSGISLLVTADRHPTAVQVTRILASIAALIALVNWARSRQTLFLSSWLFIAAGALIAVAAPVIVSWNQAKGVPIPDVVYETFPLLLNDAVHPNVMVSIMIILLPLPLSYLLLSYRQSPGLLSARWLRILFLLALLLMSIVLLLTKSRGGYVAGAAGVLTVIWFSKRRILALILTLLTSGLGLWLIISGEQQGPHFVGELADASTLAFREQVWHIALWMIGEFPLTGVGMGAFNVVAARLYPFSDFSDPGAHNLYLQVGVDLGLPGLVAFISILLLTLFMIVTASRRAAAQEDTPLVALSVGLLAGIVAVLFHGLVDITVWGTRVGFLPWLVIGLVTAVYLHTTETRFLA